MIGALGSAVATYLFLKSQALLRLLAKFSGRSPPDTAAVIQRRLEVIFDTDDWEADDIPPAAESFNSMLEFLATHSYLQAPPTLVSLSTLELHWRASDN